MPTTLAAEEYPDGLAAAEHEKHRRELDDCEFRGYLAASMNRAGDEMACALTSNLMHVNLSPDHFVVFGQGVCAEAPERPGLRLEVAQMNAAFRTRCDVTPEVFASRMEAVAALARRFPLVMKDARKPDPS